jgi:hypothetical protein
MRRSAADVLTSVSESRPETARSAIEVPRRAADAITQFVRSLATLTDSGIVAPRTSLNRPVGRNRAAHSARER